VTSQLGTGKPLTFFYSAGRELYILKCFLAIEEAMKQNFFVVSIKIAKNNCVGEAVCRQQEVIKRKKI
jgi:hypothetical protein